MSIFSKITLRTMKQSRMRTTVTIIGVILSTAMIMAVTTFGQSFLSFLRDYSLTHDGNWYGVAEYVSDEQLEEIRSDSQVEMVATSDILGYAEFDALTSETIPYLYIQSFSEELFDVFPIQLQEGRLPKNEHEVIISPYMQANEREGQTTQVGDVLELEVGDRMWEGQRLTAYEGFMGEAYAREQGVEPEHLENTEHMSFTVVGIYNTTPNMHYGTVSYQLIAGPSSSGSLSEYHDVYLRTQDPADIYDYMDTIECDATSTNESLLRWYGVADNDNLQEILTGLCAIVIGIIMVGAISLIYNAFAISLRERTVQFGLLASVGATKRQLSRSLRCEALIVSCVGIPVGCVAGIVGIGITLHFIGAGLANWMFGGTEMDIPLRISWISVLVAVAVAFATVMISAWIPCRRVRKISPIEAIRSAQDIRIKGKEVKTSKLFYRIFGLEGMLAQKNYRRDRKKYRSTVASLTMSIVLFVSVSSFGKYLVDTGSFVLEMPDVQVIWRVSNGELESAGGTEAGEEDAGGDNISEVNEDGEYFSGQVKKMAEQYEGVTLAQEYSMPYNTVQIAGGDDSLDERFMQYGYGWNADGVRDTLDAGLMILPDEVFETLEGAEKAGDTEGLPVLYPSSLRVYNGDTQRYERVPVFADSSESADMVMQYTEYDEDGNDTVYPLGNVELLGSYDSLPTGVYDDSGYMVLLLTSESAYEKYLGNQEDLMGRLWYMGIQCTDHAAVYRELSQDLEQSSIAGSVYDNAQSYEQDRQIMTAISVLSYGFIILISLIAVANVFNTISTNLMLRRKEFAMLRSVGMQKGGFRRMMCYECLIYGLRSILYGVILSLLVSFLIYRVLAGGVDTNYLVPWEYIGIAVGFVFLVVGLTMIYTMGIIQKQNIIDELKMS